MSESAEQPVSVAEQILKDRQCGRRFDSWEHTIKTLKDGASDDSPDGLCQQAERIFRTHCVGLYRDDTQDSAAFLLWDALRSGFQGLDNTILKLDTDQATLEQFVPKLLIDYVTEKNHQEQFRRLIRGHLAVAASAVQLAALLPLKDEVPQAKVKLLVVAMQEAVHHYAEWWQGDSLDKPELPADIDAPSTNDPDAGVWVTHMVKELLDVCDSYQLPQDSNRQNPFLVGLGMTYRGLGWIAGIDHSSSRHVVTPVVFSGTLDNDKRQTVLAKMQIERFEEDRSRLRCFHPDPVSLGCTTLDGTWRQSFDDAWFSSDREHRACWQIVFAGSSDSTQQLLRRPPLLQGNSASGAAAVGLYSMQHKCRMDPGVCISAVATRHGELADVGEQYVKLTGLDSQTHIRRFLVAETSRFLKVADASQLSLQKVENIEQAYGLTNRRVLPEAYEQLNLVDDYVPPEDRFLEGIIDKLRTNQVLVLFDKRRGTGKSMTARCVMELADKEYHHIIQISGRTWQEASSNLLREEVLWPMLGMKTAAGVSSSDETNTAHTLVDSVIRELHKRDQWLLLIDDLNQKTVDDGFERLIKAANKNGGRVLITTNTSEVGRQFATTSEQKLTVPLLDANQGALMILRRSGFEDFPTQGTVDDALSDPKYQFEIATQTSKRVGGLPLALEAIAAAWTAEEYSPDEILASPGIALADEFGNLTKHISFEGLYELATAKKTVAVSRMLELLSLFGADNPIPEYVLHQPDVVKSLLAELAIEDAQQDVVTLFRQVTATGLVQRRAATKSVVMHGWWQEYLSEKARSRLDVLHQKAVLLVANDKVFPDPSAVSLEQQHRCDALVPHVAKLLDKSLSPTDKSPWLSYKLSFFYHNTGERELALRQFETTVQQALALEQPSIQALCLGCVIHLHDAWESKTAELIEQAKQMLVDTKLSDHARSVLTSAVGSHYTNVADYSQGEKYCQRATEQEYDHPSYASSLHNLGRVYELQGRYRDAEELILKAIEIKKRTVGEQHPTYAASLGNLASVYRRQDRRGEAEELIPKAIEIQKRTQGEQHPHYATSLNDLASVYNGQDRRGEAEELILKAIEIQKRTQGEQHPSYATSLHNLASVYDGQGRYGESEELFLKAIEIKKRTIGEQHPSYASSLNNLASVYDGQGRHGEAGELLLKSIEIKKRTQGEQHPSYATSVISLAFLYFNREEVTKCIELLDSLRGADVKLDAEMVRVIRASLGSFPNAGRKARAIRKRLVDILIGNATGKEQKELKALRKKIDAKLKKK